MSLIAAEIAAYSSEQGREYFFCNIPNCAKCLFCAKRNGSTSEFERSSHSDVLTGSRFGGKIAELHKIFILRRIFLPPLSLRLCRGIFCFHLFCAPLGGTGGGISLVLFLRGGGRGLATRKKTRLAVFCFGSVIERSNFRFCSRSVNIEPRSKFGAESAQNGKCESDRPREATPRVRWTRKFLGYLSDYGIAHRRFCGSVFRLIAACKASGKQPKTRPQRDGSGRREKTKSRATPEI